MHPANFHIRGCKIAFALTGIVHVAVRYHRPVSGRSHRPMLCASSITQYATHAGFFGSDDAVGPIGCPYARWCWVVLYEATEHHAKMGHSYRRVTCIGHMVPVGYQAQHHQDRQNTTNQALEYPQEAQMGPHGAWVGQYWPY